MSSQVQKSAIIVLKVPKMNSTVHATLMEKVPVCLQHFLGT